MSSRAITVVFIVLILCGSSFAEDIYYYVSFDKLDVTSGRLVEPEKGMADIQWGEQSLREGFMQPRVSGSAGQEMYVSFSGENQWQRRWRLDSDIDRMISETYLAVKAPKEAMVSGRLFLPKSDWSGMRYIDFSVSKPVSGQDQARRDFLRAKEHHFERLMDLNIPGTAWFRHQKQQVYYELRDKQADLEKIAQDNATGRASRDRTELRRSYSLFSGGLAISENLQLDRELRVSPRADRTEDINSLDGITTQEIDWKATVKDIKPDKDALASAIPADQHVIFFPSFKAMTRMIDEAKTQGTPVLRLLEPRGEDARTNERYERQLCLSMNRMSRFFGPSVIRSIAFTGSDAYLRGGSDVAVVFEAANTTLLKSDISGRHKTAIKQCKKDNIKIETKDGTIEGVSYNGIVASDRSICSYTASVGNVVIVSNSLYQLERVIKAVQGKIPTLESLDEYTFFRDRYRLGDDKETALMILTDAAIRRWCGPRWRIGASRRTFAAAVMAEIQASNMEKLAEGKLTDAEPLKNDIMGMGEMTINGNGVSSSIYGSLDYMTPIAEMDIDKVTKAEADAYQWYRKQYQRRWRQFFDPIAIRFYVSDDRIEADVTVRPLIASSEYRELMSIAGGGSITDEDADRHNGVLFHLAMSLDPNSPMVQQCGNMARMVAPGLRSNALGWIGKWVTVYFEDDDFWSNLDKASKSNDRNAIEKFMEKNYASIPAALHVDVSNGFALTGFLVGLRAFIEQSAPGMTVWENLTYMEKPYVKVSPSLEVKRDMPESMRDIAVYYSAGPDGLVITLSEKLLKGSIARMVVDSARRRRFRTEQPQPWLGKSLCAQVMKGGLKVVEALSQESFDRAMKRQSWANTVILNEWRNLYGQKDPVAFHSKFWQRKLVCPGGGEYVWNPEYRTMESTVYGHAGEPDKARSVAYSLFEIESVNLGLTFEDDGLRARGCIMRQGK